MRAVDYGVLSYLFSLLFTPAFYLLIDLAHPMPLINAV